VQVSKPKKGYKLVDTGSGNLKEIPEKWETKELGDISSLSGGFAFKSEDYSKKGHFILRTMNILDNGSISKENSVFIPEEASKKYQKFELCEGDTLFVMVGATLGKVGYVTHDILPALLNQNMWLIRAKSVNSIFLNYLFKMESNQFIKKSGGTARSFALRSDFKKLTFNIPPIHEQNKITKILSNVDNTLKKTNQLIQKTKLLKKGLMQKLLTKGIRHTEFKKVDWLYGKQIEIPEEWEIQKIKKIVKIIDTPHYTSITTDKGIPVIRTSDCLPSGHIDYSNTLFTSFEEYKERIKVIHPEIGDILFTREAPFGIAVLVDRKEISVGQRIILMQTDSTELYNPYFILFFNSTLGKNQSNSFAIKTTVERVNIDDIKKFQIPIPKLSEQKQIADILSNIDSQIQKEKLNKSNLEHLEKGLMQKLLTGQIRAKI